MHTSDAKEKKELSSEELEKVSGGAIKQPRKEVREPIPDPLAAPDPTTLLDEELNITDAPDTPAEV